VYRVSRIAIIVALVASCAAPLKTDTVSFLPPSTYPNAKTLNGLEIAIHPVADETECRRVFGTDLKVARLLPIQIIVHNKGSNEYEIDSDQVFGIEPSGAMTVAYSLTKSAEKVRASSIGTTAVAGTVAGAVAGAAVGAAVGAGVGYAAGDTERGATSGAAIGGATGATAGAAAGLSDQWTAQFKQELAELAWGDRVIYPGDIVQGFVYLKWKPYCRIRLKLFNVTTNRSYEFTFPVSISR